MLLKHVNSHLNYKILLLSLYHSPWKSIAGIFLFSQKTIKTKGRHYYRMPSKVTILRCSWRDFMVMNGSDWVGRWPRRWQTVDIALEMSTFFWKMMRNNWKLTPNVRSHDFTEKCRHFLKIYIYIYIFPRNEDMSWKNVTFFLEMSIFIKEKVIKDSNHEKIMVFYL